MFVVGPVLVSDELLDAPFSCNLGACRGGCCVQGDAGAPVEPDERAELDQAVPAVRHRLRPEALAVIDAAGAWEETAPGHYATTCVDEAECVFVTYDGPVAKCALQQAFYDGQIDFEKPISCHLYPVRVEKYGALEALNYEQISLCDPARKQGRRHGARLVDFLRTPLVRKYGEEWYEEFHEACAARRMALAP